MSNLESIYHWEETTPDKHLLKHLSTSLDLHESYTRAIINRGVTTVESAKLYIEPDAGLMHSPSLMKDMDKATERIVTALSTHQRILVLGDYDVDGVSGTAVLVSFLSSCGGHVNYHIPERATEGYGLSTDVVRKAKNAGYDLIITVDSGISSNEEARVAKEIGIDLIVTDHHEPHEQMPCALAIVNPKRGDDDYPFRELAGVGVVFKLICALAQQLNLDLDEVTNKYIELVALGTIGDLVPLLDENRYFARLGLATMTHTKNKGLYALLDVAKISEDERLDTFHVSFCLAPRINAAGRIWNPRAAVELLLGTSPDKAHKIAEKLDEKNRLRIREEAVIFENAKRSFEDSHSMPDDTVILLFNENWNVGIIGIVASKLMERHYRPVILATVSKQPGDIKLRHPEKGRVCQCSGRSIKGFDMYDALRDCSDLLITYGGHALAAGLKIYEKDLPELRRRFGDIVRNRVGTGLLKPSIMIDADLSLSDISLDFVRRGRILEPCGVGNPKPIFKASDVQILAVRPCGLDGKHIQLKFGQNHDVCDAIGFGLGDHFDASILMGEHVDIAFQLQEDSFGGRPKAKLAIKDMRLAQ